MKTGAERQRAYRARGGAARGVSHKNISKWAMAQFIALDGEGVNAPTADVYVIEGRKYQAKEHFYNLLAASTGESLYNNGSRLESQHCIDFLLDLADAYNKGIFVIFGGGYDVNHWLMFGFDRTTLQKISRGEYHEWEVKGVRYSIEYRARKSLSLRRGIHWKEKKRWNQRSSMAIAHDDLGRVRFFPGQFRRRH
jgi:hypothetical protein